MQQLVLLLHVFLAITLVVLVLLQQGKGAQMGAAFGTGASQTLFGSRGSTSFLVKITTLFAALFFVTSLILGYAANQQVKDDPIRALTTPAVNKQAPATNQNKSVMPVIPNAGVPLPAGETPPASQ